MPHSPDTSSVTLDALIARITQIDLVPSRMPLLEGIEEKFNRLKSNGIQTLADFLKAVKNSKSIVLLADKTGIGAEYLTLLRRETESYAPKPLPLRDFMWMNKAAVTELEARGYKNTAALYDALEQEDVRKGLAQSPVLNEQFLDEIFALTGLTRIQWVNATFARMLLEAGCRNAQAVAAADAGELYAAVDRVNRAGSYFNGKIGLRDIRRLTKAASYVV